MATIHRRVEQARGCGYRKPGGKYLVSGEEAGPCGKLPIPLEVCPCCHEGIKMSRGYTWIQFRLIEHAECSLGEHCHCKPLQEPWNFSGEDRVGLLWIGEKFYRTPGEFLKEAHHMGISRRISQVPKDFEIGGTWVMLAHRKAVLDADEIDENGNAVYKPGIFRAFKPTAIEYIIRGDETEDELEAMEKRGFTLVDVVRDEESQMKLTDGEVQD